MQEEKKKKRKVPGWVIAQLKKQELAEIKVTWDQTSASVTASVATPRENRLEPCFVCHQRMRQDDLYPAYVGAWPNTSAEMVCKDCIKKHHLSRADQKKGY